MWQRFTERARMIIFFAQEEACALGENDVSPEHIFLGLTKEDDSAAAKVLSGLDASISKIRKELKDKLPKGKGHTDQEMQLTPRAKRTIDLAYDEARNMKNNYIGSEHILLGLVRENEGLNAEVFSKYAISIDKARSIIMNMQSDKENKTTAGSEEMKGKDFLEIAQATREQINLIFITTRKLKEHTISPEDQQKILHGKTLAMIFEKPSLRTRVSFETGIFQLGGHGIYLAPSDISLGKRESVADVARTLDRMADIIMARVFEHEKVTELAKYSKVPVINGLSDLEHPCQALADFYTILEHKGTLEGLKIAFIGDGNNVAHSLMLLAAKVGMNFAIGCPKGYEPNADIVAEVKAFAKETGATIEVLNDPVQAVKDADVIYTDVWASMGQEDEAAKREEVFIPFQVNAELMKHAKPDAIFEHCLPAHRGSEVTDEVIDSPQSVVFDEAENRLHVQKAVMVMLAG